MTQLLKEIKKMRCLVQDFDLSKVTLLCYFRFLGIELVSNEFYN